MQMYSEADVDTSCLSDKQITILGYGSQGRAHALNLKDSGFNVVVGLRPEGGSWARAEAETNTSAGTSRAPSTKPRSLNKETVLFSRWQVRGFTN